MKNPEILAPESTQIAVRQNAGEKIAAMLDRAPKQDLLSLWLEGVSEETARAYRGDLVDFANFIGAPPADVFEAFLNLPHGRANALALGYRNAMLTKKLSPATINRRLAALRSVVVLGRKIGRIVWALDVKGVKGEKYKDTSGPGLEGVKKMVKTTKGARNEVRNHALFSTLFILGLRRGEAAGLEYPRDVDLAKKTFSILGKGRKERELITIPDDLIPTLEAWLKKRGQDPGPFFGLTGDGIYKIVRAAGDKASVSGARPHGIRHTAITEVLDRSNGNTRLAQQFARHKNGDVTMKYDDNRKGLAGQAANTLAGAFSEARATEDDLSVDDEYAQWAAFKREQKQKKEKNQK